MVRPVIISLSLESLASEIYRITSLANMDKRLLLALRGLRNGSWRYSRSSLTQTHLLTTMAQDLGYPSAWGDPSILPAYGGKRADEVWKALNVIGRAGVGGVPCEIVHGGIAGGSCVGNAGVRWLQAFVKAVAIYLPVRHDSWVDCLWYRGLKFPQGSCSTCPPYASSIPPSCAPHPPNPLCNRTECEFSLHLRLVHLVYCLPHTNARHCTSLSRYFA